MFDEDEWSRYGGDDLGYINCYLSAISLYDKSGHFGQSGKLYKVLAEKYTSEGKYNNAIDYYKKSADSFSLDEYSKSNYSQVIMTYAELIAQYQESYFEAMKVSRFNIDIRRWG